MENRIQKSAEYIKALVIDLFIKEEKNILIGNEVMYGGKRKVVDLLILNNNRLVAIEIKGDNDSLKRIEEQIEEYKKIFDYVIICTTETHLKKLENILSKDIGIYLVKKSQIFKVRKPLLQKKRNKLEMLYTINTKYLKQLSDKNMHSLNSDEIRNYFSKMSIKKIHEILYSYFSIKLESKYQIFILDRGENTHIDDIPLLSSNINLQ